MIGFKAWRRSRYGSGEVVDEKKFLIRFSIIMAILLGSITLAVKLMGYLQGLK